MSDINYRVVMMKPSDNVATALCEIPKGTLLEINCNGQAIQVTTLDLIEFGHKLAVRAIPVGEDIYKYGEVIGMSNRDIQSGEHIHVHNLDGKRGRGDRDEQHGA